MSTLQKLLTKRQREITALIVLGLTNKQIGRELGITEGTVKIHLHAIYQRCGVPNRTALAFLSTGLQRAPATPAMQGREPASDQSGIEAA